MRIYWMAKVFAQPVKKQGFARSVNLAWLVMVRAGIKPS